MQKFNQIKTRKIE